MAKQSKPEVWQRGPVENIPALLQPVAHALLQAKEEVSDMVEGFPNDYLWHKPAGVASVGFHLQHLSGVLNRLCTYARGESLSEEQLMLLSLEGKVTESNNSIALLLQSFSKEVDQALKQLARTTEQILTEQRMVGRAKIPSTVIGLLVHAAEHTMRHVGQLHVTVKVIKEGLITDL